MFNINNKSFNLNAVTFLNQWVSWKILSTTTGFQISYVADRFCCLVLVSWYSTNDWGSASTSDRIRCPSSRSGAGMLSALLPAAAAVSEQYTLTVCSSWSLEQWQLSSVRTLTHIWCDISIIAVGERQDKIHEICVWIATKNQRFGLQTICCWFATTGDVRRTSTNRLLSRSVDREDESACLSLYDMLVTV